MKHFCVVAVTLLLISACGCNAVLAKRPVGEKPAKIVANDWEGKWVGADGGSLTVKVLDANKGLLKVFWLDDEDKRTPSMKSADVELRESGKWLFASTNYEDNGPSRGYLWGRIKNEDRQMIVWIPDDKAFAPLVKSGVFPGKIEGDDIILDELKAEHLKIITSGERGVLFQWDKPAVFVKAGQ